MARKERHQTKKERKVDHPKKDESVYHNYESAMNALTEMYPDIPQPVLFKSWQIWLAAELDKKKAAILKQEMDECPESLNTMDQWKDMKVEYEDCFTVSSAKSDESDDASPRLREADAQSASSSSETDYVNEGAGGI